jgi:hypothetical protein
VGGIITSTTRASRCKVIMEHEDQGVFRLEWRPNARGLDDMVLPSMVEVVVGGESQGVDAEGKPKMGGPDSHLGNTPDVISFDSSADENTYCKLTSDYRAIVILLHVPAAPNSKEQLHEILVDPPDVANLLPAAIASGIRGARGPIMDVEIGSSIETARIPWQDTVEHASIVEALFGARGTPPPSSSIANRVINLGTSNTKTGASITAIAFAAAARVYAKFADRYMGQKAGHLNPNILAEGRISEVVHEITPRGEGFSTLILPEEMLDVDMMAFLPESARRIILRLPGIDTKRGS